MPRNRQNEIYTYMKGLTEAQECSEYVDEEWREVFNFPGYFVSTYGQIYSWRSKSILKPYLHSDGTYQVTLRKGNRTHTLKIHRMVAAAYSSFIEGYSSFIGDFFDVRHIDGCKTRNHVSNLELVEADSRSKTDVRTFKRPVSVRIVGTERVFKSLNEAAKALEISPPTAKKLLNMPFDYDGLRLEMVESL